jgi:hypothetical protein
MTSIDLRAYVSGFFETEDNPAVWDLDTHTYSNLFMHVAVNPCFSLGSVNGYYKGYITSLSDKDISTSVYLPNDNSNDKL